MFYLYILDILIFKLKIRLNPPKNGSAILGMYWDVNEH